MTQREIPNWDWVGQRFIGACRFCRDAGFTAEAAKGHLIKYSVRHYAHTKCLIDAKGEEFILQLPPGVLGTASVFFFSRPAQKRLLGLTGTVR
jgi:hypothetical protein